MIARQYTETGKSLFLSLKAKMRFQ